VLYIKWRAFHPNHEAVEEYLQHYRSFLFRSYSHPPFETTIYLRCSVSSPFFFFSRYFVDLKNQLQFCTHDETSNKELFPTFARTRPPDTQISKSVASVLKAFHWHKVAFFHKSTDDSEYAKVSQSTTQQHVTQIWSISQSNTGNRLEQKKKMYWDKTKRSSTV